jgi:hypothetical protein
MVSAFEAAPPGVVATICCVPVVVTAGNVTVSFVELTKTTGSATVLGGLVTSEKTWVAEVKFVPFNVSVVDPALSMTWAGTTLFKTGGAGAAMVMVKDVVAV